MPLLVGAGGAKDGCGYRDPQHRKTGAVDAVCAPSSEPFRLGTRTSGMTKAAGQRPFRPLQEHRQVRHHPNAGTQLRCLHGASPHTGAARRQQRDRERHQAAQQEAPSHGGFESIESAERYIRLLVGCYRFKRFTDSRRRSDNGKAPLELAGVDLEGRDWLSYLLNM
jgi:hypothetical protein